MLPLRICVLSTTFAGTCAVVETACSIGECLDDTSLMQDVVKRNSDRYSMDGPLGLLEQRSRKDSMNGLLEAATNMIKNGVTPDVVSFVNTTVAEITESVYPAVLHEHATDQKRINDTFASFEQAASQIDTHLSVIQAAYISSQQMFNTHRICRAHEASQCTYSRKCQAELEAQWVVVEREERLLRHIHSLIHEDWCVEVPVLLDLSNNDPFNWARTSPYPTIRSPPSVYAHETLIFREETIVDFQSYIDQLPVVIEAWRIYYNKVIECGVWSSNLEDQVEQCDGNQIDAETQSCNHATSTRLARQQWGHHWRAISHTYSETMNAVKIMEEDRIREWQTLHVVLCLLGAVYDRVEDSIDSGEPCPTDSSHPGETRRAIDACHFFAANLTDHLIIHYPEVPNPPPLPPVVSHACEPEYGLAEYTFPQDLQQSYMATISTALGVQYHTELSEYGWPGCAAVLQCTVCSTLFVEPVDLNYRDAGHECKLHEVYLAPGESNADTMRCNDGSCISVAGLCNGVDNCVDRSDELFCGAENPPYLPQSSACPIDVPGGVSSPISSHFQCDDGCVSLSRGRCNGGSNCADSSDEDGCCESPVVSAVATSGRPITVVPSWTLLESQSPFHDRTYQFHSPGDFSGKTFIKASNDDKTTEANREMWKFHVSVPVKVYILPVQDQDVLWCSESEGWTLQSSMTGPVYSGVRRTPAKDWSGDNGVVDEYNHGVVWEKLFPAGAITIPGNGGNDGSFLMFMDSPCLPIMD